MVAVIVEKHLVQARVRALLFALALIGCGDSSEPGDGPGTAGGGAGAGGSGASAGSNAMAGSAGADMPQGGAPAGTGDLSELVGVFRVNMVAEKPATATSPNATPAHALLFGKILSGEDPQDVIWELADEQGDCKLFTPRVPFCDPGCGGSAVCVEDGECAPHPPVQDLGTLQLTGLGSELSIRYIARNYQSPTLAYPPCAEGDAVRLTTGGGSYPSFTLESRCIAPLEITGGVRIEDGQALALRWPAPGQTDLARIKIKVDISHHGGAKGKIECDVADTGTLDVPAALVDQLVDLGIAGWPTVAITREASSPVTAGTPENVALMISQNGEQPIEIPGLVSCTANEHCPAGQTCQPEQACR